MVMDFHYWLIENAATKDLMPRTRWPVYSVCLTLSGFLDCRTLVAKTEKVLGKL